MMHLILLATLCLGALLPWSEPDAFRAPGGVEATPARLTQEPEVHVPEPDDPGEAPQETEVFRPLERGAEASAEVHALEARVRALLAAIADGSAQREQADALYAEVLLELEAESQRFVAELRDARTTADLTQSALAADPGSAEAEETLADLHASMWLAYEMRLDLLPMLTPERHARIVGAGVEGMRELGGELGFVVRHLRYQRLAVPDGLRRIAATIRVAPVPAARSAVSILIAIFLFRTWRRWAKSGLSGIHGRMLGGIGPPTVTRIRIARVLWYLDRVRRPLEWMVLFSAIFNMLRLENISEPAWVLRTTVHWLLLAWLLVALVSGVASRTVWSDSKERAKLRLRSLRLVAAWFVFLGLGTELVEHFTLRGTLYSWVRIGFQLLAVPLGLILVGMWRQEIYRRLEAEAVAGDANLAEELLGRRTRIGGIVAVVLGAIYLNLLTLQRVFFLALSRFAGGRRLLAEARRREVSRQRAEGHRRGVRALPVARRKKIVEVTGELIAGVFEDEQERVRDLLQHGAGSVVVVAERGAGLSTFLQQLAEGYGNDAVLLQCPFGRYEDLVAALAEALGLEGEVSEERLVELAQSAPQQIGIVDDLHRMSRPVVGGQADLDRLAELSRAFGWRWIVGVGSATYEYLRRARENRILGPVVELPPWTEEQLGQLVEARSEEASVAPDYSRLVMRRRPDDLEFDDPIQRNRQGFLRVLWIASAGNPDVALRLWADSLGIDERGVVFVRQLLEPTTADLEELPLEGLLVLRLLLMTERASAKEVEETLQIGDEQSASILSVLSQHGWVDEDDGCFGVERGWFRTVTRVLSRKNLLAMRVPTQPTQRGFLRRQLEGSQT